jgi:Cu/Zn superoxide dismutase
MELYGNSRHAGDLINNLVTNSLGEFTYTYEDPMINVHDIIGRSIVIHSGVDDMGRWRNDYSNPERQKGSSTTGNSGSRIACSVIGLAPSSK